jgi:hypothetical protein
MRVKQRVPKGSENEESFESIGCMPIRAATGRLKKNGRHTGMSAGVPENNTNSRGK